MASNTAESRQTRVTLRCIEGDLNAEIPPLDQETTTVDHPIVDEAARVAPTAPEGQKRVLAIKDVLVFRIRHGRWRGATWIESRPSVDQAASSRGTDPAPARAERPSQVLWLLAAEIREEGSREDAYLYFDALHRAGRLLPTADDHFRQRAERAARLIYSVENDFGVCLESARARPRQQYECIVAERIRILLWLDRSEEFEEIWIAVPVHELDGTGLKPTVRDTMFAAMEAVVGEDADWEWPNPTDWPAGPLPEFEIVRFALRAI